jgi:DNA-binding PadR family transcriptional regulator
MSTDSDDGDGEFEFEHTAASAVTDLTDFQKRILAVLADESRYGLAIKRELQAYYGETVNHGRLYPNLDDLVNKGLVEKSELDKRTNEYALTEKGERELYLDVRWLADRITTSDENGGGD